MGPGDGRTDLALRARAGRRRDPGGGAWDITPDHQRFLLKLGDIYWGKTRRDMERTLARLDALVTSLSLEAGPGGPAHAVVAMPPSTGMMAPVR